MTTRELPPHGHFRRYSTYRCRCDLCRVANAQYQRLYHRIRAKQGRPYEKPVWKRYERRRRFGRGWISYRKTGEMVVGVGNKEIARATPLELAERMISEGTLAKSLYKLNAGAEDRAA